MVLVIKNMSVPINPPTIAAANNDQMFGNLVEFKRFNMRERPRFCEAWNRFELGTRAGTDDHVRAAQSTGSPVGEGDLHSPVSDESPGSQNELSPGLLIVVQIHLIHAAHHLPFALTNAGHVNREAVVRDPKLPTIAEIRCNLGTVDDVLAGKARDVWTRSTDILAIDGRDALSFFGKRPRGDH